MLLTDDPVWTDTTSFHGIIPGSRTYVTLFHNGAWNALVVRGEKEAWVEGRVAVTTRRLADRTEEVKRTISRHLPLLYEREQGRPPACA